MTTIRMKLDKRIRKWKYRSVLIDTITVVMSIFADLIVLGTDAVRTPALNNIIKIRHVMSLKPRKIGIAVQIMNVPINHQYHLFYYYVF